MQDPHSLTGDWILHRATINAVAPRGQVYNERDLTLRIVEGRHVEWVPMDGLIPVKDPPMREVWSYRVEFYLKDGKVPNDSTQRPCLIAITGSLGDGRPCKIQGSGYVGRDDHGQIEGSFHVPPRIEIIGPEEAFLDDDEDQPTTAAAASV